MFQDNWRYSYHSKILFTELRQRDYKDHCIFSLVTKLQSIFSFVFFSIESKLQTILAWGFKRYVHSSPIVVKNPQKWTNKFVLNSWTNTFDFHSRMFYYPIISHLLSYWEVPTINWSFFRLKRDAVDLQNCLPLAVREINKDQLIFLHIKRCGGSSKMPSYRCEKHQQRTDLFAYQKVMQWIFKSAFLSLWRKFTTDLFLHQKGMQSGVFNILFDTYRCLKINYFIFIVKK